MATITPQILLDRHMNELLGYLPSLFDGNSESVHRARIATRRAREVLPLAINPLDQRMVDTLRATGQHLGRVRDLDVMRGLLDDVAERVIATAGVAAVARRAVRDRQVLERRSLVKALEHLDLEGLRRSFKPGGSNLRRWMTRSTALVRTPDWRSSLRSRIARRASDAADAVRHATGIYFPNRSHRARIAVKKLRYAVEVARETGLWRPRQMVKDLRRIQATLGAMHDAQVLIETLDDLLGEGTDASAAAAIKRVLDEDIVRQQAEYLRTRHRVFDIDGACQRAAGPASRASRSLIAASVVAAPFVILGRRQAG
jgi:CHAD domain-containing protein